MASFCLKSAVRNTVLVPGFIVLVSLVLPLTGCHNSCFVFISNPGGGPILGNPGAACANVTPHAAIHASVRVTRNCEKCPESNDIRNLVVALRGIEIHSVEDAGPGNTGWVELFPPGANLPRQFDLMGANSKERVGVPLVEGADVPAGKYDRVRLRLAVDPDDGSAQIPADGPCGAVGRDCLVTGAGKILPLMVEGDALEFEIAGAGSEIGSFTVLPNTEHQLWIELSPQWSFTGQSGDGVRLQPGLAVTARFTRTSAWRSD